MEGIDSKVLIYQLKEGTSTSYYLTSGENLLPERLSITLGEFKPIRGLKMPEKKLGQLKAKFRKDEVSPYKTGSGTLHTTIWKPGIKSSNSTLLGTGDLKNTNALLVFYMLDHGIIMIKLYPVGKFSKQLYIL